MSDDDESDYLIPKVTWSGALVKVIIMFAIVSGVYLGGIFLFMVTSKAIDKASKNAAQHYFDVQKNEKTLDTLSGKK